jgi:ferredoxin-NADP reductase
MACRNGVMASVEVITDDIVEVRVVVAEKQRSSSSYSAGQYMFMNVPCISALQWHPFSITSAPREGNIVVFHVKALGGPSSWTSSLLAAAKQSANGTLGVKLDGFFGHNAVHALVKPRTAVVLVGGGVGVTPLLSILADLSERRPTTHVFLVWCTRTSKEFLAFAPRIAAAKARLGDRLHACVAITRFDPSKTQQSGAVRNVKEIVSTLANDARTTPPRRYGLRHNDVEIDEDYQQMEPPATPGSLVRVVPSMVWFGLICCASVVLMTIVFAEFELLEENMFLGMESTRTLALLLPVLAVAALCVLCSNASQHCAVLWQNADSAVGANFGESNENCTTQALSALIPELLDDRIGKRLPLGSFFDEVAATLARDRSVVEVKVVACGANAQVTEARMQCERLNRAVAAEGCLWSFQEESWDW